MSVQIKGQSYHLRYVGDEDRIVFSIDVAPGQEVGMALTRRFMRNFLGVFAKFVAERANPAAKRDAVTRDTVLDFEHSRSVAAAIAEGSMRDEKRPQDAPPIAVPGLVREAKLVPKNRGGIALIFANPEHTLQLEISPDRVHMVLETFVKIAERAGWDFPPLASWLDPSKSAGTAAGKTLN